MTGVICAGIAALVLAAPRGASGEKRADADPISGLWDASLTIPAGSVDFGLDLSLKGGSVKGAVLNGPERE